MKRNILLNPGPATTTESVKMAQVVSDICPREEEFCSLMQEVSDELLKVVHANAEDYAAVLFCGSGTLCMDVCLNSLLPAGKKVLILNNGAYSSRAVEICRAYGLSYIELKVSFTEAINLTSVKAMLEEKNDIALVYATHQETGSGLINPVAEIGEIAHRFGAVFVVDTTSTLAMRPIDVYQDNIDFCMASAQKGIQAMTGLSFVIGRRDIIEASKHYPQRSYYCNLYAQYESIESTGQMRFTPPVQTIYASRQALREYFAEGETKKWQRHQKTMTAIHKGLSQLGFKELLPLEIQAGLVAAVLYPEDKNWDFTKIHDYCYERGFTIYPGKMQGEGTFRLCALGAITDEDIKSFFSVFTEALQKYNVNIPVKY